MRRILREPLLHFLVLGAPLFVAYAWVGREGTHAAGEIVVPGVLMVIAAWKRLPLKLPEWSPSLAPYTIGAVATFWVFERIAAF